MPFTLAHTIIASPISKLTRNKLPIMALAIGSMTPDLSRLISTEFALQSHEWKQIFQQNLLLGLFFSALWYLLYRPTLFRWFSIQDHLNIKNFSQRVRFIFYCCIALMLGNATHNIWDGLTHLDSRTLWHFDWMQYQFSFLQKTYSAPFLLQISSSILPLPILFWMAKIYISKHQIKVESAQIHDFLISLFLALIAGTIALFFYFKNLNLEMWQNHTYYFSGRILNKFSQAFLIIFTCCCLYFQLKYLKYKS